jgi:hypothetical protein
VEDELRQSQNKWKPSASLSQGWRTISITFQRWSAQISAAIPARQFPAFGRKQPIEMQTLNLNQRIEALRQKNAAPLRAVLHHKDT